MNVFPGDVSSMYFLLFPVYSNFRIALPVNNNSSIFSKLLNGITLLKLKTVPI